MFEWSGTIYLVCFAASIASAIFLAHVYARDRVRLWAWSTGAFAMLAIGNFLAAVDALFEPQPDLFFYGTLATLIAATFVVFGSIWEDV